MKKATLLFVLFVLCLVFARCFGQTTPMEEMVTLDMSQIVLQHEPHPTNTAYFTLKTNRWFVTGTQILTGYVGDVVKITWNSQTNVEYTIQYTTNNFSWFDIRVRIIGNGGLMTWYDTPSSRDYRLSYLASVLAPPSNLKIIKP